MNSLRIRIKKRRRLQIGLLGMFLLFSLVSAAGICETIQSGETTGEQGVSEREGKYTLKVKVNLVNLFVTVADHAGQFITDLKKEDFLLWVDKKKKPISHFVGYKEAPLSVAVVLDSSGSMSYYNKLPESRKIITALANSLEERDEMALYTFSEYHVRKRVAFTRDKQKILKAVGYVNPRGNTALYQALNFLPGILGKPDNRQAIVLLTDGIDNQSIISLKKALENVRKIMVPIYVVGFAYKSDKRTRTPREFTEPTILETIATETGGSYFEVKSEEDLDKALKKLLPELRFQYLLGYYAGANIHPDDYQEITLYIKDKNYKVKVRTGQYKRK